MRAVVQRALNASVHVEGTPIGSFNGPGLVVLVGVTHGDSVVVAERLANKVRGLRIFGGSGTPEQSAADLDLPMLVISQFTLYGDTRKGRRPTWDAAAPGAVAEPLIEHFIEVLRQAGTNVATGKFGADMKVTFTNDGPVTILLEIEPDQ
jgi:D-tyrosyl-tRNA(Tyr) deacylase